MLLYKNDKLSVDDLFYLNALLKSNLKLKDCFELLKTDKNSKIFEDIIDKLDKGEEIEQFFGEYLNKNINVYFKTFIKKISFSKSLNLSLSFNNYIKDNSIKLIKTCVYPLGLLFLSLSFLYFFDLLGMDKIFSLLNGFEVNYKVLEIIRIIFRVFIYLFYLGLLFIIAFIVYMCDKKRIIIFYEGLCKILPNNLMKTYYSSLFISLFKMVLDNGYSFKESLVILKGLIDKPIISLLAYQMSENLEEGELLEKATNQACFDGLLSRYIRIAGYSESFIDMLSDYVLISELRIQNKLKNISRLLESFIYLFVGAIIIFIYEILFLPLEAIGGI